MGRIREKDVQNWYVRGDAIIGLIKGTGGEVEWRKSSLEVLRDHVDVDVTKNSNRSRIKKTENQVPPSPQKGHYWEDSRRGSRRMLGGIGGCHEL